MSGTPHGWDGELVVTDGFVLVKGCRVFLNRVVGALLEMDVILELGLHIFVVNLDPLGLTLGLAFHSLARYRAC
jgi:hypothetical protein